MLDPASLAPLPHNSKSASPKFWSQMLLSLFGVMLTFWAFVPVAQAYNNPELLPSEQTPIIDLAHALSEVQVANLSQELDAFEAETGWKLRVLTQFDRTPGRAIKNYWNLDDRSFLLVADPRGGNLLNFNVGRSFYQFMPRTFWVELQTRYGNQYYVRDYGEDGAILGAVHAVKSCIENGGCKVVPGLPYEQWVLTFITSIVGGLICGLAAHPRRADQVIAWQWALMLSPLWGILFIGFGIGPVISRTAEWLPLLRNVAGFALAAVAAYLVYQVRQPSSMSET
jgi:hypothetical protein